MCQNIVYDYIAAAFVKQNTVITGLVDLSRISGVGGCLLDYTAQNFCTHDFEQVFHFINVIRDDAWLASLVEMVFPMLCHCLEASTRTDTGDTVSIKIATHILDNFQRYIRLIAVCGV